MNSKHAFLIPHESVMWVDKYRTEEALIESELSLGPMLLGKMGSFDGLCKTEYNNKPMFITKIDYERKRLVVETGVDADQLPTFASLPYDKLKEGYYCEQHLKMENVDCLGASRATNLKAALAAGGLDVAHLTCVPYRTHPNVPLASYSEQKRLADAIGATVVYGHYVFGRTPYAFESSATFNNGPTPMIKDKHGNYIDVIPLNINNCKPTMNLFIEDPWMTLLSLNGIKGCVLPFCTYEPCTYRMLLNFFPFGSKVFSPHVKEDHAKTVELRKREEIVLMDRRTFVALALRASFSSDLKGGLLASFSLDLWPIVRSIKQCSCCGIHGHLDIVTCSECHAAHYCSKLCLKHHCRAHKKDCKRPDWMERAKAAEEKRKARLAAHEANAKAEAQLEKDKEMARKRMAENERKLKAAAGDKPYTLPGESHRQTPKNAKPPKSMEEKMAQMQFKEEKPLRAAAFVEKQQREHQEAVARKSKAKADAEKAAAAEASKEYEASVHLVPPPAKMELPF